MVIVRVWKPFLGKSSCPKKHVGEAEDLLCYQQETEVRDRWKDSRKG